MQMAQMHSNADYQRFNQFICICGSALFTIHVL